VEEERVVDEVDLGLEQRLDVRGARPADLLAQPSRERRGRVGGGEDVGGKDDAPAALEEVGGEMTVLVDDL
jgi:hypothetical protein